MQIFRFYTARVKTRQIIHVIFQTNSQFFFKVWITLSIMRDNSSSLFQLKIYMLSEKSSTSKCKFSDLLLLVLKFTKFIMSLFQPRASFSSNFTPLISVMRDHSVLFHLKLYMLSTKGTYQSANFETLVCFNESSPSSSCQF